MIKKLLLSSCAAVAITGSALAADLPARMAPPPPAPVAAFTWTGAYIGGNAGYGWNRADTNVFAVPTVFTDLPGFAGGPGGSVALANGLARSVSSRPKGFIGGGQLGFNYQFSSVVLGLEADFQGTGIRSTDGLGTTTVPVPGFPANAVTTTAAITHRLDYLGTLRGRLGFAAMDRLLIYGTGGLAYGFVRTNFSAAQTILGPSASITTAIAGTANQSIGRAGWTLGGGVEYAITPNWSIKGEYLYYDLGTTRGSGTFTSLPTNGAAGTFAQALATTTTRWRGSVARGGINYRFTSGEPAPVVARY